MPFVAPVLQRVRDEHEAVDFLQALLARDVHVRSAV